MEGRLGLHIRKPCRHAADRPILEDDPQILHLLARPVVLEETEDRLHDRLVADEALEEAGGCSPNRRCPADWLFDAPARRLSRRGGTWSGHLVPELPHLDE